MAPIPTIMEPMAARRGWGEDRIFFEHTAPCRDRQRHQRCQGHLALCLATGIRTEEARALR